MRQELQHQGPDGYGVRSFPSATLVHTRLSAIDLSESGAQPMANGTGTIEKRRFRSMDGDVFEITDGGLLVNELQVVFGLSHSVNQIRKDGIAGRFVQKAWSSEWILEPGDFARNACGNERIRYLVACRSGAKSSGGLL